MAVAEPSQPAAPSKTSIAYARSVAAWLAAQLDLLDGALVRGEADFADRVAALILGAEKMPRVKLAMSVELHSIATSWPVLELRWARARKFCAFPTEQAITEAIRALTAPPYEPIPKTKE